MPREPDQISKLSKFPNFEEGEGAVAGPAPVTLEGVKSDILVATRQYAKRQLTWFAREPTLRKVMLTGNQSLLAALRDAAPRTAVMPDLF